MLKEVKVVFGLEKLLVLLNFVLEGRINFGRWFVFFFYDFIFAYIFLKEIFNRIFVILLNIFEFK